MTAVELHTRLAPVGAVVVGLEIDHPDQDAEQRAYYGALADRLDLVRTGASDCHGARYDFRMGCETTDTERFTELKRRAGR